MPSSPALFPASPVLPSPFPPPTAPTPGPCVETQSFAGELPARILSFHLVGLPAFSSPAGPLRVENATTSCKINNKLAKTASRQAVCAMSLYGKTLLQPLEVFRGRSSVSFETMLWSQLGGPKCVLSEELPFNLIIEARLLENSSVLFT